MKFKQDEGIAEVRAARAALCARFGNDPAKLLRYLRQQQEKYPGRIIRSWSELKAGATLTERAPKKAFESPSREKARNHRK